MDRAAADRRAAAKIALALGLVAVIAVVAAAIFVRGANTTYEPAGQPSARETKQPLAVAAYAKESEATAAPEPVGDPKTVQRVSPPDEAQVIQPRASSMPRKPSAKKKRPVQRLSIAIGDVGYEPSVLSAKSGAPIELTVAKGAGCAAGFIIPELGVSMDNSAAPATKKLGILKDGDYRFSCAMGMVEGLLKVR